nr:hypothetical protein [uncultured Ruminococcus sp.]
MLDDEQFDVFLAYYGNSQNGSENAARDLYNFLSSQKTVNGRMIRVYFHPETKKYGQYGETPRVVARTPMFLLVADKRIPRNEAGQLSKYRENGTLREVYEEVNTFHQSRYKAGGDDAARVYISDEMDCKEAELLDSMFLGKTAFTDRLEVLNWIHTIKKQELIRNLHKLASTDKREYMKGEWIAEAEGFWERDHDEQIGRSLLVYYMKKVEDGDLSSKKRVQEIYEVMISMPRTEKRTDGLLEYIRRVLLGN